MSGRDAQVKSAAPALLQGPLSSALCVARCPAGEADVGWEPVLMSPVES